MCMLTTFTRDGDAFRGVDGDPSFRAEGGHDDTTAIHPHIAVCGDFLIDDGDHDSSLGTEPKERDVARFGAPEEKEYALFGPVKAAVTPDF